MLRAFAQGGYANLRKLDQWNLGFVTPSPSAERYETFAGRIDEALEFMTARGATGETIDFFTSQRGAAVAL